MSSYEQSAGLNARVLRTFVAPRAIDAGKEVVVLGKQFSPVDTGLLVTSIHALPPIFQGTRVTVKVVASAVNEKGTDYSVFQEFGTRYLRPVRYMGRAARRVSEAHGYQFGYAPAPWPHKGADPA